MQFFKLTVLAVGGGLVTFALFKITRDAPGWVKALGFIGAIGTVLGIVVSLPQALDAIDDLWDRMNRGHVSSPEVMRRRAEEEARRRAEEEKWKAEEAKRQAEIEARQKKADHERIRSQEQKEYSSARGNLQKLRSYVASCAICEHQKAAESDVAMLEKELTRGETERQRKREEGIYRAAGRNLQRLKAYLESCSVCEYRQQAQKQIDSLEAVERENQKRFIIVQADRCKAAAVCASGMVFSLSHRSCIPLQHYGGTIPGSEDDRSFVGGRWVPNCPR